MSDWLETATGRFQLERYRAPARSSLRAWDAADEYALSHLHERDLLGPDQPAPLLVNDGCGALAVALHGYRPIVWSDSRLAELALRDNLASNGLPADCVTWLPSTECPSAPCSVVVIKVPKTLALLRAQLHAVRPLLDTDSSVVGAAMTRHVHNSTIEQFSEMIGPTRTTRARKKARLLLAAFEPGLTSAPPPAATHYSWPLGPNGPELVLCNRPGVFSARRIDIGSRFLLEHFPDCADASDIVDLGCGNGVLGCVAAWRSPTARVHFVDQSYLAVASARESFARAFPEQLERAYFSVRDCLDGFVEHSVDLVLCNPPFHDDRAVGVHLAARMFADAAVALRPGGSLVVVANRHLGYASLLRRWFDAVQCVAENRKFVILHASR